MKFLLKCVRDQKGGCPDAISGDAGYTLIELMIALMILAIGVLGVWSMQGAAVHSNVKARQITGSAALGSDQFEKLMRLPYDDAMLAPGSTTIRDEGNYSVTWTVSNLNEPIANVKTVTVTASWREAGQQRKVEYVYYKADEI